MGMCKSCGNVVSVLEMTDGLCKNCLPTEILEFQESQNAIVEYFNNNRSEIFQSIIATGETSMEEIETRIDFVSAQFVYGLNSILDLFTKSSGTISIGREESLEEALENATEIVIGKMKKKAYFSGADAIIGIRVEHAYSNNIAGGSLISVFGTGTLVKLKEQQTAYQA